MSVPKPTPETIRGLGARLEGRMRARLHARSSWRIPLAALRPYLDAGWEAAHWSIDAEEIPGRSLVQTPGRVRFPVRLDRPVSLAGRVRLVPHDWLDGTGSLSVAILAEDASGRRARLWSRELGSAAALGPAEGAAFLCEIPRWCATLSLELTQLRVRDGRAVGRVMWIEPVLHDHARPSHRPRAAARDGARHGTASRLSGAPAGPPLFSILTPVHDPPVDMLAEAIESVRGQSFTDWELCLVDDGSQDPEVIAALVRYAHDDPRIHLERRERAGGISSATNAALEMARGEYIALLDHDDTLVPDALARVAEAIRADPALDMVYSDEDIVADGRPIGASHKPGWSPENLLALMYTCHVGVYRRRLAQEIGGFRSEFDGCQDYDFVLRLVERSEAVGHIPHVLYHWRAHASSTAGGDQAKPYAYVAQPRAIAGHLARRGARAEVQFGPHPGMHRIVYDVDPATEVALVLGVSDATGLAEAARSWAASPFARCDVVLAAPAETMAACRQALATAGVGTGRVTHVPAPAGTPPPALLALAAERAATERAAAEQLVLMSAPALGLTHDWLRRVVGYSAQAGIAAAAPLVLSATGRIRDAGAVLPDGLLLHLLHGLPAAAGSPVATNVSAAGSVVATSRAALQRAGGLDPAWRELTLVEFCLRAGAAELRTVLVPDARVRLTGHDDTMNDLALLRRLRSRRGTGTIEDPYYNPHFRADRADFAAR